MSKEYPTFTRVNDGICHGPGMAPFMCVCGKQIAEIAMASHSEVCTILHMQRILYSKNNRRKQKQ